MLLWSSYYLPSSQRKATRTALIELHLAHGYQVYNPYPNGSGTPLGVTQFVRLFLTPKNDGWLRLAGQADTELLLLLAKKLDLLLVAIEISLETGTIQIFNGDLTMVLAEGKTITDFEQASYITPLPTNTQSIYADPISEFAQERGVSLSQAQNLIQKTTQHLFRKQENDPQAQQAAQQALTHSAQAFSWQMPSAQRILAQAACLNLPPNWQNPSYTEISAAYSIACLLEQSPQMPLLPSDEAILDRVPYPLDYTPLYFAK